ncbi:MAG: TIGR04283 family arsenosugar biosynthesis glycosyltransferase [Cellulosilyticaceae bacterium]
MKISIIIPILNEENKIEALLNQLNLLQGDFEVIFVDGGSTDKTNEKIGNAYSIIRANRGRACQMNAGAKHACGEVIWFLHCDTLFETDAVEMIEACIKRGYEVGCFKIAFDTNKLIMKCCGFFSNLRVITRRIAFGDQGIFITKQLFDSIGGFPDLPLMEDYKLSMMLKERRIALYQVQSKLVTSARRFEVQGALKTMYKMQKYQHMFRKGVSAWRIASLYETPKRVADDCIHCNRCTKVCSFLQKYKMDLSEFEKRQDLAYHCFLCGECLSVCPKGIDGRKVSEGLRRKQAREKGEKAISLKYFPLVLEKKNYKFKNYRHVQSKSVLFLGCNFPAHYPETTKQLVTLFKTAFNMGVVFDCCGKPVAELGLENAENTMLNKLERRLKKNKIEEIVVVCPNCYDYLKERLDINIITIYEKLKQEKIDCAPLNPNTRVFLPCPDREKQVLFHQIQELSPEGNIQSIENVQCCGLGGGASKYEPELAKALTNTIESENEVYVYCASCAGQLARQGKAPRHILLELLGANEEPVQGVHTVMNRMKYKLK